MGWKDAFDDTMRELKATREQLGHLDDPTVGLTALPHDLMQSRLKILESSRLVSQGGGDLNERAVSSVSSWTLPTSCGASRCLRRQTMLPARERTRSPRIPRHRPYAQLPTR